MHNGLLKIATGEEKKFPKKAKKLQNLFAEMEVST